MDRKHITKKHPVMHSLLLRSTQKSMSLSCMEAASGTSHGSLNVHAIADGFRPYSPFVQRVWISLELKQVPYQYIEVDPYKKPQSLLDVNPRGLIPALRHGKWSCHESTVLMEYVSISAPAAPPSLCTPFNPILRTFS